MTTSKGRQLLRLLADVAKSRPNVDDVLMYGTADGKDDGRWHPRALPPSTDGSSTVTVVTGATTTPQQFFNQNTPAPAFVGVSTAQQLQAPDIVLPKITSAVGDLLLIVLAACDFSGAAPAASWQAPAGWTVMFNNQDLGTAQMNVIVYYKTAAAVEDTTYTFTRTDNVATNKMWANGALIGYRPISVPQLDHNYSLNRQTPSGGAPTTAGVSATNHHDRLVCIFAGNSNPNFTAPASMTQRSYTKISPPNTGTCYLGICDEALTAPGDTGARTATLDQNTNGQADALLINP